MTTEQKTKTGITLASLLVVLAGVGAGWGHIEPFMTWAVQNLGVILGREQVQACLAATVGGQFLAVPLPHLLPGHWPQARTRFAAGFVCAGVTFALAWTLVPTRIGFVYAMITGFGAVPVSQMLAGLLYWMKPAAKPESLQP